MLPGRSPSAGRSGSVLDQGSWCAAKGVTLRAPASRRSAPHRVDVHPVRHVSSTRSTGPPGTAAPGRSEIRAAWAQARAAGDRSGPGGGPVPARSPRREGLRSRARWSRPATGPGVGDGCSAPARRPRAVAAAWAASVRTSAPARRAASRAPRRPGPGRWSRSAMRSQAGSSAKANARPGERASDGAIRPRQAGRPLAASIPEVNILRGSRGTTRSRNQARAASRDSGSIVVGR